MPKTLTQYSPPTWAGAIDLCSLDLTAADAASAVSRIFGEGSATIAAWCAYQARDEGNEAGYRLWLAAFKQLSSSTHLDRS